MKIQYVLERSREMAVKTYSKKVDFKPIKQADALNVIFCSINLLMQHNF